MGTGLEDAGPSTSAGVGVGMGMLRMPVFRLPPSTAPPPISVEPVLRQLQTDDWDCLSCCLAPGALPPLAALRVMCDMLLEPGQAAGNGGEAGAAAFTLGLLKATLDMPRWGNGGRGPSGFLLGQLCVMLAMAASNRDRAQVVRALDLLLLKCSRSAIAHRAAASHGAGP